jgi:hypothetical protein
MSQERVEQMLPRVPNSGVDQIEERDTACSAMVTQLLTAYLRSLSDLTTDANKAPLRLMKHTRDEVLLKDARLPWRRSPFWTMVRIALQLTITGDLYKRPMVRLPSSVVQLSASRESDVRYAMILKVERRLSKLKLPAAEPTLVAVCEVLTNVINQLSLDWEQVQLNSGEQVDLAGLRALFRAQHCDDTSGTRWFHKIHRRSNAKAIACGIYSTCFSPAIPTQRAPVAGRTTFQSRHACTSRSPWLEGLGGIEPSGLDSFAGGTGCHE